MNLQHLNDQELVSETSHAVKDEHKATTKVLHHFREIERRRLFCAYKLGSLFEMAMKHFGYTENEAQARISAMRVLKDLPELEEKVNSGHLTLTHLNMARTYFRKEQEFRHEKSIGQNMGSDKSMGQKKCSDKPSREEMLSVLEKLENTSKREAQVILTSLSSEPVSIPRDEIRLLDDKHVLFKFVADRETETYTNDLKGLLAHKYPNLSTGELFKKLCELGLQEWSPAKEPKKKVASLKSFSPCPAKVKMSPQQIKVTAPMAATAQAAQTEQTSTHAQITTDEARVAIATQAAIERQIWKRDNLQCTNCGSKFAPEKDHRIPRAKGGDSSIENLRLLCRKCNQRAAIEQFGQEHMDNYLN